MKKFLMTLMLAIISITVVVSNAEARRLGGGGSFGKSSPTFSRQAPAQNNQALSASRPAPAAPAASPWKGIVGGALLGLGMGALLSHFGMGGALGSMMSTMLMVALFAIAAIFLFRLLSRKTAGDQPKPAFSGLSERSMTPEIGSNITTGQAAPSFSSSLVPPIPADFDTAGFLRHAKTNFLRMQAAWDKADSQDIREFTTPEMFGELKMQLTERGATANNTDVVSLDAELLGIESGETEHLASVRFYGMIREAEHAPTEPFNEIWILSKPISSNSGWMLAGLQQV